MLAPIYVALMLFIVWGLTPAAYHYTWWIEIGQAGVSPTPWAVGLIGAERLAGPEFSAFINPSTGFDNRSLDATITLMELALAQQALLEDLNNEDNNALVI